jgi:subfamily B ATP-binding cassette protein MsbA
MAPTMWIHRLKHRLLLLFGEDSRAIIPRLIATDGRKHAKGYALSFLFMFFAAAPTALTAYLMKDVINRIFVDQNYWAIWVLAGVIIVLYTVKGFSAYGQALTLGRIGNRIVADYQKRMYDHLLKQGVSFYAEQHSTDLINRIQSGATGARQILDLIVTSLGRELVTLIGLIIVMVIQDPYLAVVGVVVMPIAVFGVRRLIRSARKIVQREFAGFGQIFQTIQETAQGIRIVKSFNLENRLRARMAESVDSVERASNRMIMVTAGSGPLMETLGGFAVAGVIMYAGDSVLRGGQTPGEFFSVITALLLSYEPAKRLARLNIDIAANLMFTRFLFEVLDRLPSEQEETDMPKLMVRRGRIEFRKVVFGYRSDEPILRAISFVAEPGQTTALVGPSGGGKSTIMNLIVRFYDPEAGIILIDDQDISRFSRRSLRDATAYVSQDVFLFSGSVRDNIAMGLPDAGETEIIAAAKAAHAHDFIEGFAKGYDTAVGEHGLQVSGGQRARIAIARAFLKNAPILLLDEPTSALDSESEHEVQRALDDLRASRTTLVIAHRLQTVIAADKICVVDSGQIVEIGRHEELVARRARYYSFYEKQFNEPRVAAK